MADGSDEVPLNGPLEVGAEYDCFEALELRVVSWVNDQTPEFRVVTADRTYRREDAKSEVRRRMYEADERTPAMVAADLSTATLRCSMHAEGCPFRVYATQSAPGAEWCALQASGSADRAGSSRPLIARTRITSRQRAGRHAARRQGSGRGACRSLSGRRHRRRPRQRRAMRMTSRTMSAPSDGASRRRATSRS